MTVPLNVYTDLAHSCCFLICVLLILQREKGFIGTFYISPKKLKLGCRNKALGVRDTKNTHIMSLVGSLKDDVICHSLITVYLGPDGVLYVVDGNHRVEAMLLLKDILGDDRFSRVSF